MIRSIERVDKYYNRNKVTDTQRARTSKRRYKRLITGGPQRKRSAGFLQSSLSVTD